AASGGSRGATAGVVPRPARRRARRLAVARVVAVAGALPTLLGRRAAAGTGRRRGGAGLRGRRGRRGRGGGASVPRRRRGGEARLVRRRRVGLAPLDAVPLPPPLHLGRTEAGGGQRVVRARLRPADRPGVGRLRGRPAGTAPGGGGARRRCAAQRRGRGPLPPPPRARGAQELRLPGPARPSAPPASP